MSFERLQKVKSIGTVVFEGWVVGIFQKRSGQTLYAVEDKTGAVRIFKAERLEPA